VWDEEREREVMDYWKSKCESEVETMQSKVEGQIELILSEYNSKISTKDELIQEMDMKIEELGRENGRLLRIVDDREEAEIVANQNIQLKQQVDHLTSSQHEMRELVERGVREEVAGWRRKCLELESKVAAFEKERRGEGGIIDETIALSTLQQVEDRRMKSEELSNQWREKCEREVEDKELLRERCIELDERIDEITETCDDLTDQVYLFSCCI